MKFANSSQFPAEIEISVTQEHINRGLRQSCSRCPISNALRDRFPTCIPSTAYGSASVYLKNSAFYAQYALPEDPAGRFIAAFDGGLPVRPFTFVAKRLY